MTWDEIKKKWAQVGDFTTDGCTGAPDLFWKECCKEHDFNYRNSNLTGLSRAEADKRLRRCMRKKGSGHIVSWIYWLAVRSVGWKFWNK